MRPQSQAAPDRSRRPGAPWSAALLCGAAVLAAVPSLSADAAIIAAPQRTPLIAFDRWQYLTGWPSGYALKRVLSYLRTQEERAPIAIYSSIYNPPGDALTVLLGGDRRVTLANVDFGTLRAHPLHAAPGRQVFLIACRPYGQSLPRHLRGLRLMLHAANADGHGGVDLYRVTAP